MCTLFPFCIMLFAFIQRGPKAFGCQREMRTGTENAKCHSHERNLSGFNSISKSAALKWAISLYSVVGLALTLAPVPLRRGGSAREHFICIMVTEHQALFHDCW